MAWKNLAKKLMLDAYLGGETLIFFLLKDTHTPDPDDDYIANVVADEADATNYARQTIVLGATPAVQQDATDEATLDTADVTFATLGGAANNDLQYLGVAVSRTNDADSEVVDIIDVGAFTTSGVNEVFNIADLFKAANSP